MENQAVSLICWLDSTTLLIPETRDQNPNPPTLLCAARHQRKKHRTCLWKSQPDLMVELLSMVSGHCGLSPSCAHILCPQKHAWFTMNNFLGALVYTRNWQWPNARRRLRKGHLPLGCFPNYQRPEAFDTLDLENCF